MEWEVINIKTLSEIIGTDLTIGIGIELVELVMPQSLLHLISESEVIIA